MPKSKAAEISTAIAAYKPVEPDQISLEEGDFVEILDKSEDAAWWYGQKIQSKKSGWFPATYVQPIRGKVSTAAAGFLGALHSNREGAARKTKPELTPKPNLSNNHEFKSRLELLLQKNPVNGSNINQATSKHPPNVEHDQTSSIEATIASPTHDKPAVPGKLVVVIAAYKAIGPSQLDLHIGDVLEVDEEAENGWSNGHLVNSKPPLAGWFPSSYVKVLNSEYRHVELLGPVPYSSTENRPRDEAFADQNKANSMEMESEHEKSQLSDQSFESDDSDYDSSQFNSSPSSTGRQLWGAQLPIAIMSLESIDAVQLYTRSQAFPMQLSLTMASDWRHATIVLTTKSALVRPACAFYTTTSIYSAEWIVDFRLNIYNAHESLIIKCFSAAAESNEPPICLAEATMTMSELINHSKHLKKFTKGLPIRILDKQLLVPHGPQIKPCFLVKFDIIDIRS